MFYLCFSPKRVYRFVGYHRQTKNQWARDDPAFLALLIICLTITAIVYGIVYHQGFLGTLKLILWMVFVDYILVGCIIATVLWFFCNKFLLHHPLHTPVQRAEWAYCFDVHSNAFFPMFLITYVLQLILIPVVTRDAWISTFVGNTMYLIAMAWYIYVTYLGYNVLPFLKSQNIFLYPLPLIFIFYVGSLFGYNVPKHVLNMYFG
ncbi:hypothetical protein HDU85_006110 [Gaertneriomyces sp. JEL0708]|nr:hypothetical protein HDU85_006110 [Gaertneriomyces sp. JEL0708]